MPPCRQAPACVEALAEEWAEPGLPGASLKPKVWGGASGQKPRSLLGVREELCSVAFSSWKETNALTLNAPTCVKAVFQRWPPGELARAGSS